MPPGDVAPFLITTLITTAVAVVLVLRGPVGRALGRRLEGNAGDPGLRAELDELRARVAESDALAERVAELEERVDFSERLLAQQDRARLTEGRHG